MVDYRPYMPGEALNPGEIMSIGPEGQPVVITPPPPPPPLPPPAPKPAPAPPPPLKPEPVPAAEAETHPLTESQRGFTQPPDSKAVEWSGGVIDATGYHPPDPEIAPVSAYLGKDNVRYYTPDSTMWEMGYKTDREYQRAERHVVGEGTEGEHVIFEYGLGRLGPAAPELSKTEEGREMLERAAPYVAVTTHDGKPIHITRAEYNKLRSLDDESQFAELQRLKIVDPKADYDPEAVKHFEARQADIKKAAETLAPYTDIKTGNIRVEDALKDAGNKPQIRQALFDIGLTGKEYGQSVKATKEFEASLKESPKELQEAYAKGGVAGYNKAVDDHNKKIVSDIEANLDNMPEKLAFAYTHGGIDEYNKAAESYNKDLANNYTRLPDDKYIANKDIDKIKSDTPKLYTAIMDKGYDKTLGEMEKLKSEDPKAYFKSLQSYGIVPEKALYIGTTPDGNVKYIEEPASAIFGAGKGKTVKEVGLEIGDILVPGMWARNWKTTPNWQKGLNIGLDLLIIAPLAGGLARMTSKAIFRMGTETLEKTLVKELPSELLKVGERGLARESLELGARTAKIDKLYTAIERAAVNTAKAEKVGNTDRFVRSIEKEAVAKNNFSTAFRKWGSDIAVFNSKLSDTPVKALDKPNLGKAVGMANRADEFADYIAGTQREIARAELKKSLLRYASDKVMKQVRAYTAIPSNIKEATIATAKTIKGGPKAGAAYLRGEGTVTKAVAKGTTATEAYIRGGQKEVQSQISAIEKQLAKEAEANARRLAKYKGKTKTLDMWDIYIKENWPPTGRVEVKGREGPGRFIPGQPRGGPTYVGGGGVTTAERGVTKTVEPEKITIRDIAGKPVFIIYHYPGGETAGEIRRVSPEETDTLIIIKKDPANKKAPIGLQTITIPRTKPVEIPIIYPDKVWPYKIPAKVPETTPGEPIPGLPGWKIVGRYSVKRPRISEAPIKIPREEATPEVARKAATKPTISTQTKTELMPKEVTETQIKPLVKTATRTKTGAQIKAAIQTRVSPQTVLKQKAATKIQTKPAIKTQTRIQEQTRVATRAQTKIMPKEQVKPRTTITTKLKAEVKLKPVKLLGGKPGKLPAWTPEEIKSAIAYKRNRTTIVALKAPYKGQGDIAIFSTKNPPEGLQILTVEKGRGSPQRSARMLKGRAPERIQVDDGFQDIVITRRGNKPRLTYRLDRGQRTRGDITTKGAGRGYNISQKRGRVFHTKMDGGTVLSRSPLRGL